MRKKPKLEAVENQPQIVPTDSKTEPPKSKTKAEVFGIWIACAASVVGATLGIYSAQMQYYNITFLEPIRIRQSIQLKRYDQLLDLKKKLDEVGGTINDTGLFMELTSPTLAPWIINTDFGSSPPFLISPDTILTTNSALALQRIILQAHANAGKKINLISRNRQFLDADGLKELVLLIQKMMGEQMDNDRDVQTTGSLHDVAIRMANQYVRLDLALDDLIINQINYIYNDLLLETQPRFMPRPPSNQ